MSTFTGNNSELGKTVGEQSGNAKTHLEAVTVSVVLNRISMIKQIKYTKSLIRI